jgi:hypothetical protein
MALVAGTNCGFVLTAPSTDPAGTGQTVDDGSSVSKSTTFANSATITEMGFYVENATQEANFEVGIYAATGVIVPGEARALLYSDTTNAKGTGAGWKIATGLNWAISANTVYWLALQIDNTATGTNVDIAASGHAGYDWKIGGVTNLDADYNAGALADGDGTWAIYAVVEAAASPGALVGQSMGVYVY